MKDLTDDLPDMTGIDPMFTVNVPAKAQIRLSEAIPECRLVWNSKIEKYQVVYREPTVAQQFGAMSYLRGWQIIATFDPPLDIENIINLLRKREAFQAWKLREMGYTGDSDREVIEAYLDDAENIVDKMSDDLHEEAVADYFSGPLARVRDEKDIWLRRWKRAMDNTKRHSAHTRIVVPTGYAPKADT